MENRRSYLGGQCYRWLYFQEEQPNPCSQEFHLQALPKKRRKESSENKKEYNQDVIRKGQISIGRKSSSTTFSACALLNLLHLLHHAKYYCSFLFIYWCFLLFFGHSHLASRSIMASFQCPSLLLAAQRHVGQILWSFSGKKPFILKWLWCAGFPYYKQQ